MHPCPWLGGKGAGISLPETEDSRTFLENMPEAAFLT